MQHEEITVNLETNKNNLLAVICPAVAFCLSINSTMVDTKRCVQIIHMWLEVLVLKNL